MKQYFETYLTEVVGELSTGKYKPIPVTLIDNIILPVLLAFSCAKLPWKLLTAGHLDNSKDKWRHNHLLKKAFGRELQVSD